MLDPRNFYQYRKYFLPIGGLFAVPTIILGSMFNEMGIDIVNLHPIDVTYFGVSIWTSFFVSYAAVYWITYFFLRLYGFGVYLNFLRKADRRISRGRIRGPRAVLRHLAKTERRAVQILEHFNDVEISPVQTAFWAILTMWVSWSLPIADAVKPFGVLILLFLFNVAISEGRKRAEEFSDDSAKTYPGVDSAEVKKNWASATEPLKLSHLFHFAKYMPELMRYRLNLKMPESWAVIGIFITVLSITFGDSYGRKSLSGPERAFYLAEKKICGILLYSSQSGYFVKATAGGNILKIPEVTLVERFPDGQRCAL